MRRRRTQLALAAGAMALALSAVPTACGGRTELIVLPPPADAAVRDVATPDTTLPEADVVAEAEAGADSADTSVDSLQEEPDAPQPCSADVDCTTTTFCRPQGMCGPDGTCLYPPRDCDDGLACTTDACDEPGMKCTHAPDDTLCPDTELCSPTSGCSAFVYAVGVDNHLYEVSVPTGAVVDVGMIGAFASDIALSSDSTLYLTDSYDIYSVDRTTATTQEVSVISPLHMYGGLGTFPVANAPLYSVADTNQVFSIDPVAGLANLTAPLPNNYQQDGDLSAVDGQMYVAVLGPNGMTDTLATIDVNAMTVTPIADTGVAHLYGLATLGGVLYGLSASGEIMTIDVMTALPQTIAMGPPFQGAAGR